MDQSGSVITSALHQTTDSVNAGQARIMVSGSFSVKNQLKTDFQTWKGSKLAGSIYLKTKTHELCLFKAYDTFKLILDLVEASECSQILKTI